jgi:hypothetical protein
MNLPRSTVLAVLVRAGKTGPAVSTELAICECGDDFEVVLGGDPPWGGLRGMGPSLFEALCALRRALEPLGKTLGCAGACLHVYPSPMSLSMGEGRMAYKLTLGKQATREDLVDIFAPAADGSSATVDERRETSRDRL